MLKIAKATNYKINEVIRGFLKNKNLKLPIVLF